MLEELLKLAQPIVSPLLPRRLRQAVTDMAIQYVESRRRQRAKRTDFTNGVHREEIERLKSRQGILEGKFRALTLGLPGKAHYHAHRLVTPALMTDVSESDLRLHAWGEQGYFAADCDRSSREPLLEAMAASDARVLAMGFTAPAILTMQHARSQSAMIEWIIPFQSAANVCGVEGEECDYYTAIAARKDAYSVILCPHMLHHLNAIEQGAFLRAAADRLARDGTLWIELPNLACRAVREDLYWADPFATRLYSATHIRRELEAKSLRVTTREADNDDVFDGTPGTVIITADRVS